jgi:hypothetical protein
MKPESLTLVKVEPTAGDSDAVEARLIQLIANRASDLYKQIADIDVRPAYIANEVYFVHSEICRLRLKELSEADDGNFAHDVAGIHRHLDIANMTLTDGFSPRFAVA